MRATRIQDLSSALILLGLAAGCATGGRPLAEADCESSITSNCLVQKATEQLSEIEDAADRVTALTEIASAQFAIDSRQDAMATLSEATKTAEQIGEPAARAVPLKEIVLVLAANNGCAANWNGAFGAAQAAARMASEEQKQWDLFGRLTAAQAQCGDVDEAIAAAYSMPETSDTLSSFKARTLMGLATVVANRKTLQEAGVLVSSIEMGIPYYRAVALTDIARVAMGADDIEFARKSLKQAIEIAEQEANGYFRGGMLREIAGTYQLMEDTYQAQHYFSAAAEATRIAPTAQHRARALSRVATVMSDFRLYDGAADLIPSSIRIANNIDSEQLRYWSYYEIAGGAAFSGRLEDATTLLNEIPTTFELAGKRLRPAAQRDVAWGFAKHGKVAESLQLAMTIDNARERVQALSRIARLRADPDMHALSRYL